MPAPAGDRDVARRDAAHAQFEMFVAADALGGLDVRLGFYRGFDEFKVSRWTSDGRELAFVDVPGHGGLLEP